MLRVVNTAPELEDVDCAHIILPRLRKIRRETKRD